MISRLLRFGAVGAVGFVVDASLLLAFVTLAALAPIPARIWSFVVAATVTFALNQRFTFRLGDTFSIGRWAFYLLMTAIGACINISVYQLWIANTNTTPTQLVVGAAAGSVAAMFINYFVSSTLVFRDLKRSLSDK